MWKLPLVGVIAVCTALLFGYAGAAAISTISGQFVLAVIAAGLAITGLVEGWRMIGQPHSAPDLRIA